LYNEFLYYTEASSVEFQDLVEYKG